jgi:zinc dependent phospholipase C
MRHSTDGKAALTGRRGAWILIFSLLSGSIPPANGYSVLTHEAIIDSSWDHGIQPLLLKRFPSATPEELKEARSYSYGGSAIQDIGYYPFGNKFLSDLVHYVRSGDFIQALIRDSTNLNEFAFALGALAHYCADNNGHPMAINVAVPILYPKLKRKYGDHVTYAQNPAAHLKTEFAFDVLQSAEGRYATEDFHDRVGFKVSRPVLERAFQDTYSIDLNSLFSDFDMTIGSYRRGVSTVIPKMTEVAWQLKKDEIEKGHPGITKKQYIYRVSKQEYRKRWNENYQEPGFGTRFLAFLIRIIPKVGPFRALSFRVPTPETEKLFRASFRDTTKEYQSLLTELRESGHVTLLNDNCDTGGVTRPGQYSLADDAYAKLMDRLAKNHFAGISPELRQTLLAYYSDLNPPFSTKKKKKEWARVVQEVDELKGYVPAD